MKILLICDDDFNHKFAQAIANLDHQVVVCRTPENAAYCKPGFFEHCGEYDALITDSTEFVIPCLKGEHLFKRLQEWGELPNKIVFLAERGKKDDLDFSDFPGVKIMGKPIVLWYLDRFLRGN